MDIACLRPRAYDLTLRLRLSALSSDDSEHSIQHKAYASTYSFIFIARNGKTIRKKLSEKIWILKHNETEDEDIWVKIKAIINYQLLLEKERLNERQTFVRHFVNY